MIGVGIGDADHVVVNVCTFALTAGAKVVVRTDKTLVASSVDGSAAAVADYARMEGALVSGGGSSFAAAGLLSLGPLTTFFFFLMVTLQSWLLLSGGTGEGSRALCKRLGTKQ